MNELHLFAGVGGGILGGMLLGHTTVCAVEINKYCRRVLLQRQRDGLLPRFPIWDDIRTFDGTPWKGRVDVLCGGFPCQDISAANSSSVGITGERSGLWREMARVAREIRPQYIFVENSPMLVVRGLETVLADLAAMGYDATWCVMGGASVGGRQHRKRIWILAHSDVQWVEMHRPSDNAAEIGCVGGHDRGGGAGNCRRVAEAKTNAEVGFSRITTDWWENEPPVGRVAHGVARWVDRIRAAGNGQIPAVAAQAFMVLSFMLEHH